jgi:flagellar hook-associated protein 3 FlgL
MTSISTLGQSMQQIERLKTMQASLANLQYQLTSGKKTDVFAGLGTQVLASERARANFNQIDTYISNMNIADRRVKMQVNAIDGILKQAGDVVNAIQIQTQQGEFEQESVGDLAKKARDYIIAMLNERDGDRYLFSGADTQQIPVTDTGIQSSYLNGRVNDWVNGVIDTDELIASYSDSTQLTDTINGYSASLSSGNAKNVFVRVDENVELNYTTLANNKGFRDILSAVGALNALCEGIDEVTLDPDDPTGTITAPGATKEEKNANFYKVFNDIAVRINQGLDYLENETYKLSSVSAQMNRLTDDYKTEKNTLAGIVSDVEDADPNEVAVKINSLQLQLEASYRVTASISQLSLAYLL